MKLKKNKKITVRFSRRLKEEMQKSIINNGYGMHGKSKWFSDAINSFTQQSDYVELVEHGVDINQAELAEVEAFLFR